MMPIGILGGTFDPVHHGHLRLALECLEQAALSQVRLIPLHTPPHRRGARASGKQRLRMLELATHGSDKLVIDDCELARGGTSYTIDTLKLQRERLGGTPVCLIMGMDAFQTIHSWREWQSILDYAHILVADRPGEATHVEHGDVASIYRQAATRDRQDLQRAPAGKIFRIGMPLLEISATRIRTIIGEGRDPHFLLPSAVIQFILKEKLYLTQS